METQSLIQDEIIRAVLTDKKKGKPIKQTIRELAKEFSLTEFMVKGIIEASALYGLEQVQGPKAGGKNWKPIDYAKAIKQLSDKVYHLEAELVKLRNSIGRESPRKGFVSHRFTDHTEPIPRDREEDHKPQVIIEGLGSVKYRDIPVKSIDKIKKLRGKIDRVRDKLESENRPIASLSDLNIEILVHQSLADVAKRKIETHGDTKETTKQLGIKKKPTSLVCYGIKEVKK